MKIRKILSIFFVCVLIFLSGCSDKLELDETTISLVMGIDKGEKEKFTIYQSNPVFSEEAKESVDVIQVEASTIREARKKLDAQSSGNVLTRKLQVLLISKEVLKETNIFPYLDVFYRDPKNAINARIVVVDGDVKEIVESKFEDKPRIAVYLSELIDTTKRNESTVRTTFQRFHWQTSEKGITPMVAEIKKVGEEIEVMGTALLNKEGLYTMSLDKPESALLLLLRKKIQFPVPLTLKLDDQSQKNKQQAISLDVHNVKYQVDTSYEKDKFVFNISLGMNVSITENLTHLPLDSRETAKQIENAFKRDIDNMIKKVQKKRLAPFGLGVYARAYEYDQWKKVENEWPEAFAKADIIVKPQVKILAKGIMNH